MNMNAHDKYMSLGIVRNGSNNILTQNILKLALKCTIPLRYETIPCFKMQTTFLEALRHLEWQIKLSFAALKTSLDT